MELLDNKTKLLGDDLRNEIIPGSRLKIVASYFSIYAFETLKKELESIDELEFIFPSPTFVSEGIKGTVKKEAKEFYIPKQLRESSLYGTEFEIRLRNQMTQRVIARECAEWVRNKVKFKSNISPRGLQNFIYLDNGDKKVAYTPIQGFTAVDLGYEQNNMFFQGIMKQDDANFSSFFFNQFKTVWDDADKLEDVTEAGRGVPSVVSKYGEDAYVFSEHFIDVIIPFNKNGFSVTTRKGDSKQPENIRDGILDLLSSNNRLSRKDLSLLLGVTEGSIRHHLNKLQEEKHIKRIGPDKGGYWEVIK